jgi:hypothetical protein
VPQSPKNTSGPQPLRQPLVVTLRRPRVPHFSRSLREVGDDGRSDRRSSLSRSLPGPAISAAGEQKSAPVCSTIRGTRPTSSKKGRAKPRPRTREGHEFTRATKSQKWLRASAPEAQAPTPISAPAKQISSPAPTLEYDTALRSPSPADSASSNFGVGHSMHQTSKFSSALRTPPILLALVIFASDLSAAEWKEKVLYSFQGGSNGATPAGGVVFDRKGNLYGATTDGGSSCPSPGCGTVFQLTAPATKGGAWTETILYGFSGNDGSQPAGSVIVDTKGNLYGTTAYGGSGTCILLGSNVGCGVVYELSPPARQGGKWTYTAVYNFKGGKDGQYPSGDLVFDRAGNLYGTTVYGGGYGTCNAPYFQHCGTVFKLSPPKKNGGQWKEKVLHSFKSGKDGANPNGALVLDSKGAIYGTTYGGGNESGECGAGGCGTAFDLMPPTRVGAWTEKILHRFNGQDGANPSAGVVFGRSGKLYGTASAGATGGNGAVFDLAAPAGGDGPWKESVLYHFNDGNDGTSPRAGIIFDPNDDLYGTALGGATHFGVVFRLEPPKHGIPWPLTILYNLRGSPDGDHPTAGLIFDGKGNLYSTTEWGGTGTACQGGCGTVFEVGP